MAQASQPTKPKPSRSLKKQRRKMGLGGNLLGMVNLGQYYADVNEDGHRDLERAHMYMGLAASAGHPTAAQNRDKIQTLMSEGEIESAQKRARDWVTSGE